MYLEKLLEELLEDYVDEGQAPVDIDLYSTGKRCETCGKFIPNQNGYELLSGGQGTNLCWEYPQCYDELTLFLNYNEALELIKLIKLSKEK